MDKDKKPVRADIPNQACPLLLINAHVLHRVLLHTLFLPKPADIRGEHTGLSLLARSTVLNMEWDSLGLRIIGTSLLPINDSRTYALTLVWQCTRPIDSDLFLRLLLVDGFGRTIPLIHHKHFQDANGASMPPKSWSKAATYLTHCSFELSLVATGQFELYIQLLTSIDDSTQRPTVTTHTSGHGCRGLLSDRTTGCLGVLELVAVVPL